MNTRAKLLQILSNSDELYCRRGKVLSVSLDTCDVSPIDDDEVIFEDAIWRHGDKNYVKPSVGSYVWVAFISKYEAIIIYVEEPTEVLHSVNGMTLKIDNKGLFIGSNAFNLGQQMKDLLTALNDMLTAIQSMNYAYASPGGPANTGVSLNTPAFIVIQAQINLMKQQFSVFLTES